MIDVLRQIRWTDAVDVVLVAAILWTAYAWLRRTRSRLAMLGVVFLTGIYLAARQLGLQLTVWILQGFYAVLVIVLIVVFQEDLRRLFEQIAVWGLRRRAEALGSDAVDMILRAVAYQTRTRTGALYVIPGRRSPDPYLEGGIELDARLSEPLLLSLFDPHSPGHDGAVVIAGPRLARFAVHLPLSTDHVQVGKAGTRHAAALGLAERTDALCVAVSEERGTVSVARDGRLRQLESPGHLASEIRSHLEKTAAGGEVRGPWRAAWRRWPEGVAALTAALAVWMVLIPGSRPIKAERTAEVVVESLPADYVLEAIKPPEVQVTVQGPRLFLPPESEKLRLRLEPDPGLLQLGRRTFSISPAEVEVDSHVTVVSVDTESVQLSFAQLDSQ